MDAIRSLGASLGSVVALFEDSESSDLNRKLCFGTPLVPDRGVAPLIFLSLLAALDQNALESEGLFRVSGSLQQLEDAVQRIESLYKQAYERSKRAGNSTGGRKLTQYSSSTGSSGENQTLQTDIDGIVHSQSFEDLTLRTQVDDDLRRLIIHGPGGVHTVAAMLKRWLRELPEPLMTHELYPEFVAVVASDDGEPPPSLKQVSPDVRERWIMEIGQLLLRLPRQNQIVLVLLVLFLRRVVSRQGANRMGPENVAVVIGPNILAGDGLSPFEDLQDSPAVNVIVHLLVSEYSELFAQVENELFERDAEDAAKRSAAAASQQQNEPASESSAASTQASRPPLGTRTIFSLFRNTTPPPTIPSSSSFSGQETAKSSTSDPTLQQEGQPGTATGGGAGHSFFAASASRVKAAFGEDGFLHPRKLAPDSVDLPRDSLEIPSPAEDEAVASDSDKTTDPDAAGVNPGRGGPGDTEGA